MALSAVRPPAVFLDKDGTLIHDRPYNVDPARIRLRDGAGPALARLRAHGYRLVLVTNQPGIARGLFPPAALESVWAALAAALAPHGVALDAIYHCPHAPVGGPAGACECRKPRPGLLLRAAREHGLALERSWMIGDILDDVEAGRRAGCRTILLDVGAETTWREGSWRRPHVVVASLAAAAAEILARPPAPEPAGPLETPAWPS